MSQKKILYQGIRYRDVRDRLLSDPEVRKAYDALEPAFQVIRLRHLRGLTQKELAEKVGTGQSSIARLESGAVQPSLSFLRRVVEALDGEVFVTIAAREEVEENRVPA